MATAVVAAAAVIPATGTAASPTADAAAIREFDGRVVSINREARTFRVRDLERGTVRIRVTRGTRFERIAGFRGLRRGLLVEVTARGAGSRWRAIEVERPGRSGGGGEDD